MTAVAGTDPANWNEGVGYFPPVSPLAGDAGMAALTGPRDIAGARRALAEAGYNGQKVVLLSPSDFPTLKALADVTADPELASIFAVATNSIFLDATTRTMIASGDPRILRDQSPNPEVREFLNRGDAAPAAQSETPT